MQTLLEQIDKGQLWTFPGGIHPPERKSLSNQTPIQSLPLPPVLWIPLRQHIGVAGELLVKSGDKVLKGQPLTRATAPMTVPVHAPTSGTIGRIEPRTVAHPSGLSEPCIELLPDGEDHWRPRTPRSSIQAVDNSELRQLIQDAGIVGLGGATFPSAVKLGGHSKIRFLLINGAECEPYISADDRLMREQADAILQGIEVLRHLISPERVVIAVEDNKPEAQQALTDALSRSNLTSEQVLIRTIPTKYPSGSEKQLVQILTGQEIPQGKLPADLGILMHNVGTCFAIKQAVFDDMPLIERVVTVTGEQAGNPGNYWVRLGSPIDWLLAQSQTEPLPQQPLIMGGPMMGFALPSPKVSVQKATNCLLVPSLCELPPQPPARNCIRCGECAQVCPQQLLPQQLYWHSQAGEHDKAEALNLFDCIECGVCAFVCPSDIPLVQHYRLAKSALKDQAAKHAKAEQAKIRFEARQARLAEEKAERESRHKKAAALKPAKPTAGVAAAIAKLKAAKADDAGDGVDMAELRRRRKEQARLAKAQKESAEAAPSTDSADVSGKPAAVAAAIARAKAKQAAAQRQQHKAPTEPDNAEQASSGGDAKRAAVAAAVARAKAKQAAAADASKTADAPAGNKPNRSAAVAAAIAKAKAKQAAAKADSGNATEPASQADNAEASAQASSERSASPEQKRSAVVAAAIAKAKAKQAAAKADSSESSAQASSEMPASPEQKRKAAVAAAIAKAKAKQAAAKANSADASGSNGSEPTPPAQQADSAAPSAQASSEQPASPEQKRKAAVAAAIAKAKAKQAAANASSTTADSGDTAEPAPQVDNAEPAAQASSEMPASPEQKRKAAVAAAIAKAKAKQAAAKANSADASGSNGSEPTPPAPQADSTETSAQASTEKPASPEQKRKAAVAAAIAKAKAKQAAKRAEDAAGTTQDKENN
ncbi:electron transport complex subunit RsxC [Ferrimonas marina]|uniref:Ion-translocating oxidoreductase complex subunit C n=1 Tax=Ferrimonas marina TaxID=299255 RepID=A0A1M5Z6D9_9GAMM|nr:electron transport complex subunit RsxC [Ferrimonas marina]SHI19761.1 electron transport complex protein RnfC [Ferrimonas marina]